jgi:hypothetical protein
MSLTTEKIGPVVANAAGGLLRQPSPALLATDILHLAELVPVVRSRLALAPTFPDDAILASLRTIAAESGTRDRWRVAFTSNIGVALASGGRDLNTALNTLIAMLPRALS